MARFKLLIGQHIQRDPSAPDPTPEQIKLGARRPSRTFNAGEVVESDIDLVKKHGAEKFVLLSGSPKKSKAPLGSAVAPGGQVSTGFQETSAGVTGLVTESETVDTDEDDGTVDTDDGLDNLTVTQLKDLANQHGVALSRNASKGEIIEALRTSRRQGD